MVKVNDSLYASRYETSNRDYNHFLGEIAKKDSGLYVKYAVDSLKWRLVNKPLVQYYHRHIGFENYPVVCVSYESALAYCSWLTDLYNNEVKRAFKKVGFVLPSEAEWELAALGHFKNSVFPWGTNSMRDQRKGSWQGTFLANFTRVGEGSIVTGTNGEPIFSDWMLNAEKEQYAASGLNDRAFYTAEVNTFFPNNLGIYNQSGNAAEMTIEKGLTKGGSWNSFGGELRIKYRLLFHDTSPEVGFRVFMKIIE